MKLFAKKGGQNAEPGFDQAEGFEKPKSIVLPAAIVLALTAAGGYFGVQYVQQGTAPVPYAPIAAAPAPQTAPVADLAPPPTVESAMEAPPTDTMPADALPPDTVMATDAPPPDVAIDPLTGVPVPSDAAAADGAPVVTTDAQPPGDLPVPEMKAEKPAVVPDTAAPSAAELAIVQNAAKMEELAQGQSGGETIPVTAAPPVTDPMAPIEGDQTAVVRPLPTQYVVVKKNEEAGDIDTRLTAARLALMQGRNAAALQLFDELYKDYPRDKRVLSGRAIALQKMGQQTAAIEAYEEVLVNDPKSLEALTNMLGLLKRQDSQLALSKLEELRNVYPYNPDITAQLGVAYAEAGDYPNATKFLDMAEVMSPGNVFVLYNKAILLDKTGRRREAADLYRQLVRMAAEGSVDPAALPIEAIKRRLSVMR